MAKQGISAAPPYLTASTSAGARFDWTRLMAQPSEQKPWTVPEALLAVLFSAAASDAQIKPLEQEALIGIIHRSKALRTLSPDSVQTLHKAAIQKLSVGGEEALAGACEALPPELRLPAFAHALDIALSDGELGPDEAAMLNCLAGHLQLHEEDVLRVADVLAMKCAV